MRRPLPRQARFLHVHFLRKEGSRADTRKQSHRARSDGSGVRRQYGTWRIGAGLCRVQAVRCELRLINLGQRVKEMLGLTNLLGLFAEMGARGSISHF